MKMRFAISLLMLGMLGAAGCGRTPEEPVFQSVTGTVRFNGKPIPKAEVTFHPQFDGPGWVPVAVVNDDGTFAAGTKLAGDGALPGKYKVTFTWRPAAEQLNDAPNLLPEKFASPKTSPIEIEVSEGSPSTHKFELKN
ncbi:carboxypeptidase-like regulatory domain-containing protein [Lacunimicrobium album]